MTIYHDGLGSAWRNHAQAQARTARRPIKARLLEERDKAYRITTGLRTVWIPKRGVTHDPESGVFTMPNMMAERKLLD